MTNNQTNVPNTAIKGNNKAYTFNPHPDGFNGTTAGSTIANTGFTSCTFALATCN